MRGGVRYRVCARYVEIYIQSRWCFVQSQFGWTALIWAAANGHVDCVRLLIDAGADTDASDNVRRRSLLG